MAVSLFLFYLFKISPTVRCLYSICFLSKNIWYHKKSYPKKQKNAGVQYVIGQNPILYTDSFILQSNTCRTWAGNSGIMSVDCTLPFHIWTDAWIFRILTMFSQDVYITDQNNVCSTIECPIRQQKNPQQLDDDSPSRKKESNIIRTILWIWLHKTTRLTEWHTLPDVLPMFQCSVLMARLEQVVGHDPIIQYLCSRPRLEPLHTHYTNAINIECVTIIILIVITLTVTENN